MIHHYIRNSLIVGALAAIIIVGLVFDNGKKLILISQSINTLEETVTGQSAKKSNAPEISGWIAWWIEEDGLAVTEKYHDQLSTISPGWLKLDKDKNLVETGKVDKEIASKKIKSYSLKLYPMMTTDMSDQELANFTKDQLALDGLAKRVAEKLKAYDADGLDLDFENIGAAYSTEFSTLVKTLGAELKKNHLGFSVTVQAQTGGQEDWSGAKGQDLKLIGQYADEVRIMIYDRHGQFSPPGPITPMDWYQKVLDYNLSLIPKEKLVIGLPTYGYVWEKSGGFKSFQFKDFITYAKDKNFKVDRDPESNELSYVSPDATGWLSDSAAVTSKMEYARKLSLDRFVLWNLSGTDEAVFEKEWPDQ